MNPALPLVSQKLYHAALLLGALRRELERQDAPARALLEAFGPPVCQHLREAYGWFLLVLGGEPAGGPTLPRNVDDLPHSVDDLVARAGLEPPLRGELVELAALERADGWLGVLLAEGAAGGAEGGAVGGAAAGSLAVAPAAYSLDQLQAWADALTELIDRMGDSLEES